MLKNQKGITLVALVITIIVLLILAGVTLAMISGQDGILTKAVNAKKDNEIGAAKDEVALRVNELIADYYEDRYVTNTVTATGGITDINSVGQYVVENFSITGNKTTNGVTVKYTKTSGLVELTYDGRTTQATISSTNGTIGPWSPIANVEPEEDPEEPEVP